MPPRPLACHRAESRRSRLVGQKELAERAGVALDTIHEFEKGRRTPAAYIITAMRATI